MDQERTLAGVVAWAKDEENIRMVVVTGSFARGTADELSDLDIELYVRDPSALIDDRDWYRRFGDVLAVEALENPGWNPTRLVYYVDGKIDFMIGALSVLDRGVSYDRAYRVLVDKDGLADRLRVDRSPSSAPTAEEFRRCVDWFTAAALMEAKAIVRDEPWMAKIRDAEVKETMLQMIEWDHRVRYGWGFDTWHLGTHMRRWMDRDVQDEIERCWAGFSLEDGKAALLASIELFTRVCGRTADALGYEPFDRARVGAEGERILRSR
ncbi:MAG: aminoglycoside 6-adenylyltransferase [Actinomycetota bacterium]